MNKLKRLGVILLLSVCLVAIVSPQKVHAASGSVSVSKVSGNVGSNVTVTCSIKVNGASVGAADVSYKYDTTALKPTSSAGDGWSATGGGVIYSGYATSEGKSSLSFSVTFKILKEGSFPLTVTSAEVYDWGDNPVSVTKSNGSVTGKAVTSNNNNNNNSNNNNTNNNTPTDTRDKNSKLSNLQVSPGSLSPAFASGTTTYTVTVPGTTKDLTISATPQSSKATVSVSGGKDLKLGANTARVTVVAENGSSTVYTLNIMCGEEAKIVINDIEYKIDEAFTDEQIPTGFMRNKVLYEGREYMALKSEKGNMQLLSLKNDTRVGFVIYDEEAKEFHPFTQVKFDSGRFVIPIDLQDNIKAFEKHERTVVTISGVQYEAWKLNEEYSVICAMDSDGEIELYQYDSLDGTLQRFSGDVVIEVSEQELEEKDTTVLGRVLDFVGKYHLYLIAVLGLALLIIVIVFICYVGKQKNAVVLDQNGKQHPSRKHRGRRRKRRKVEHIEK